MIYLKIILAFLLNLPISLAQCYVNGEQVPCGEFYRSYGWIFLLIILILIIGGYFSIKWLYRKYGDEKRFGHYAMISGIFLIIFYALLLISLYLFYIDSSLSLIFFMITFLEFVGGMIYLSSYNTKTFKNKSNKSLFGKVLFYHSKITYYIAIILLIFFVIFIVSILI